MAIVIAKNKNTTVFPASVKERSGVNIDLCLQCRRCSSGCPVAAYTESSPSEIIRKIQLGAEKEVLGSDFIWNCASCATCFSRCPMKINMAGVVDTLRAMATEKRAPRPAGNMPLMNSLLLGTMKRFGRTYDLGAMAMYKAGTLSFLKDTAKFPMLLFKRKIALMPPRKADKRTVKQIFNRSLNAGGK